MNMLQAGLCDKKLLLMENRSHVWRDLSRLVDVESNKIASNFVFFRQEFVGDLNMPQSGL